MNALDSGRGWFATVSREDQMPVRVPHTLTEPCRESSLDRLLDPENPSVTLGTISRAAKALGRKVRLEMVKA